MRAHAVLIASAKLRPGEDRAFAAWQARHKIVIDKFPGFISSDVIPALGMHASLATFISNSISVFGTTFEKMPLCIRWFGWWLFTEKKTPTGITPIGLGFLAALFAIEVGALWHLLPW